MPHLTPIKRTRFEKFLKAIGCRLKRVTGDHFIYDREGLERPVVVPYDKEVPVFIIRSNLRTLKISPDEYLKVLQKI